MPTKPTNKFAFAKDAQGYPAHPNEAFYTEWEIEVPIPRRGSGAVLELQCGQPPRYIGANGPMPIKV